MCYPAGIMIFPEVSEEFEIKQSVIISKLVQAVTFFLPVWQKFIQKTAFFKFLKYSCSASGIGQACFTNNIIACETAAF